MSTRPFLFLLALFFCGLVLMPVPAAAGEYGAFASDPTPFWDDKSSSDIDLTFESGTDSVNVTEDPDTDFLESGGYAESFAVVTDWVLYAGESGDSISTDGDVMTWTIRRNANPDGDYVYSNVPTAAMIPAGAYTWTLRYKHNVTTGSSVSMYGLTGDMPGGSVMALTGALTRVTDWTVLTGTVTFASPVESVYFYTSGTTHTDQKFYVDYFILGGQQVDFAIPLQPSTYQTFQVGLEVGGLGGSTLTLTPYMNTTSSLWSNQVNATHIVTKAGEVYAHDGLLRFWWSTFEGQRDFRLRALHWNGSMIFDEHFYFGKGRNNFLNFTSTTAFDDEFVIWYMTGDLDYRVWYGGECWTTWTGGVTAGSVPNGYSQGPLGVASGDNVSVDTSYTAEYSMSINWFGYLRFEQWMDYEIEDDGAFDDIYKFTVEVEHYTIEWMVEGVWNSIAPDHIWSGYITIKHDGVTVFEMSGHSNDLTGGDWLEFIAHLAVWHDLTGVLGVMWADDQGLYNYTMTEGDLEAVSVWTSTDVLTDWTAEVTVSYSLGHDVVGHGGLILTRYWYPAGEFYCNPNGYVQPHFSNTYGEHPINQVGPGYFFSVDMEHGFNQVWSANGTSGQLGNGTALNPNVPNPILDPFGWLAYQIGSFIQWLADILIKGFAFVFEAALVMQAAAFVFIFNSIAPGLGTAIISFFSGIISLLVSFVSLLGTMFAVLIAGIGYIQWFIGAIVYWANYGLGLVAELLADDGVKEVLVIAPLGIVSFVYLRSGFQGLWDLGVAVVNIALRVAGFVYNMVIGLVEFIMGFVPVMG